MDIIINGNSGQQTHDNNVSASFILGYEEVGGTWTGSILMQTSSLSSSLSYAKTNNYAMVVRSYTGMESNIDLAFANYPDVLTIMPAGSNTFTQVYSGNIPQNILITGAGDDANETGYNIEFFAPDPIDIEPDVSSFSNGVIAGQIAYIMDQLSITDSWEARYRAQQTGTESGSWHATNGYGKINITESINYTGSIDDDPFITPLRPLGDFPMRYLTPMGFSQSLSVDGILSVTGSLSVSGSVNVTSTIYDTGIPDGITSNTTWELRDSGSVNPAAWLRGMSISPQFDFQSDTVMTGKMMSIHSSQFIQGIDSMSGGVYGLNNEIFMARNSDITSKVYGVTSRLINFGGSGSVGDVYGFYSLLGMNTNGISYHFYGEGDYPSYFGGDITSSGNLHMEGNITASLNMKVDGKLNVDNGTVITGSLIVSGTGDPLQVGDSMLFVSKSGNVGIGTTTPDNLFTLQQLDDDGGIKIYGYDDRSSYFVRMYIDSWGVFNFVSNGGGAFRSEYNWFDPTGTGGTAGSNRFDYGSGSYTQFRDSADNPVMTITGESGSVGIRTISPSHSLDVSGSMLIQGDSGNEFLVSESIVSSSADMYFDSGSAVVLTSPNGTNWRLTVNDTGVISASSI